MGTIQRVARQLGVHCRFVRKALGGAGKKVLGRKRHSVVDTLGLIHGLTVHPANVRDRDGAKLRPGVIGRGDAVLGADLGRRGLRRSVDRMVA